MGAVALAISLAIFMTSSLRPLAPPIGPVARGGRRIRLRTEDHRLTLLHFWATWCVPCRSEIPLLAAFARKHAADGIAVVAVAQDPSFQRVDDFLGAHADVLGPYLDPDGRYASSLAVTALPCTIVLDETGATVDRYNASVDWSDPLFERQIVALAQR